MSAPRDEVRGPEIVDGALPSTVDLVIIGGGISGAASAFFAARAGLQVLVIERRNKIASLTTAAATGAFRLQHDNAGNKQGAEHGWENLCVLRRPLRSRGC